MEFMWKDHLIAVLNSIIPKKATFHAKKSFDLGMYSLQWGKIGFVKSKTYEYRC